MNFLFHTGEFDNLEPTLYSTVGGGVFTLRAFPAAGWSPIDGQVRVNESPPQVVHEYERFHEMAVVWVADR